MAFPIPKRQISPGCKPGEDVKWLQDALNNCGAPQAMRGRPLGLDGDYGAQTQKALKLFQEVWGLTVDGVAGMKTIPALAAAAVSAGDKMRHWAAYCGRYMVRHDWRYEHGSFSRSKTWHQAVSSGRQQASCAAFVSWVAQLAGLLDAEKEISHTSAGVGSGAKAVKYASNLHGGKYHYPKAIYSKVDLHPGDICWYDSNICIYAGGGQWWDAGGPFSANCDKSTRGKDRYIAIPSAPTYDRTMKVLAYYRPNT